MLLIIFLNNSTSLFRNDSSHLRNISSVTTEIHTSIHFDRKHFCQLRKAHDDPVLTLDGQPIPVVEETKFLGVIFDKKLTLIPHIKKLNVKKH